MLAPSLLATFHSMQTHTSSILLCTVKSRSYPVVQSTMAFDTSSLSTILKRYLSNATTGPPDPQTMLHPTAAVEAGTFGPSPCSS